MTQAQYSIHPNVKQLLASDSLAEAQIVAGGEYLARQVSQVISTVSTQPRPGSLVVTRSDSFSVAELEVLPQLSALVLVKSGSDYATIADTGSSGVLPTASAARAVQPAPFADAG